MSKLEQLRDLIEKKGYSIVSGHWDGSGITLTLFGLQDKEALYVSSTDEDYRKIFNYVAEKMGASKKG
jgi:hypothetical protein